MRNRQSGIIISKLIKDGIKFCFVEGKLTTQLEQTEVRQ